MDREKLLNSDGIKYYDGKIKNFISQALNTILPTVTEEDNGKQLKVIDGSWQATDAEFVDEYARQEIEEIEEELAILSTTVARFG